MSAILHSMSALDYLLTGAMLILVLIGAKRGLAPTMAGFVGTVLATVCGILGSALLTNRLASVLRMILAQGLASYMSYSQDFLDQTAGAAVAVMQGNILKPIVFSLCYLLVSTLWLYACGFPKVMGKFKPAAKFNEILGALMGAAKGFLILCALVYVIRGMRMLPSDVINSSFLIQRIGSFLKALAG